MNAFTLDGSSDGNGELSLSDDKTYLSVAGYNRDLSGPSNPGTISLTHTLKGANGNPAPVTATITEPKDTYSSEISRLVAKVSATGGSASIDTSTVLAGNTLSASAPRQALGINGKFYITGNGNSETGDSTYNGTTWSSQPKNTTDGGVVRVDVGGGIRQPLAAPAPRRHAQLSPGLRLQAESRPTLVRCRLAATVSTSPLRRRRCVDLANSVEVPCRRL